MLNLFFLGLQSTREKYNYSSLQCEALFEID